MDLHSGLSSNWEGKDDWRKATNHLFIPVLRAEGIHHITLFVTVSGFMRHSMIQSKENVHSNQSCVKLLFFYLCWTQGWIGKLRWLWKKIVEGAISSRRRVSKMLATFTVGGANVQKIK